MRQVASKGKQVLAARNEKKKQDDRDTQMADLKKYAKSGAAKTVATNKQMRSDDRAKQEMELKEMAKEAASNRKKKEASVLAGMSKIKSDYFKKKK